MPVRSPVGNVQTRAKRDHENASNFGQNGQFVLEIDLPRRGIEVYTLRLIGGIPFLMAAADRYVH